MKQSEFRFSSLLVLALPGLVMMFSGCGTVEETTVDDWTNTPPISVTARLEYRVDSLMHENRKLKQQLESSVSENTGLSSRNAELEGRIQQSAPMPTATTPPATARTTTPMRGGYESALAKYRSKNYQGAIDHFNELIRGGMSNDLLDNCHYWVGESYFGMRRFEEAIQQFQIVTGLAGSDKADDAQFMIGNAYVQAGRKDAAREEFQKLLTLYPSSPLAQRARARMNSL